MMRKRIYTDKSTDFLAIPNAGHFGEAPIDGKAVVLRLYKIA